MAPNIKFFGIGMTIVVGMVGGIESYASDLAPKHKLPPECSGVPGDFRTPHAELPVPAATHGPGAEGRVVEIKAVARPPWEGDIPPLYVYGPSAEYVNRLHAYASLFEDPDLVAALRAAYWGELVNGKSYLVPNLDKCSQAVMIGGEFSFRAPEKGILFVQFVGPGCRACNEITRALRCFIAENTDMSVRWVRVVVPEEIARIEEEVFFHIKADLEV